MCYTCINRTTPSRCNQSRYVGMLATMYLRRMFAALGKQRVMLALWSLWPRALPCTQSRGFCAIMFGAWIPPKSRVVAAITRRPWARPPRRSHCVSVVPGTVQIKLKGVNDIDPPVYSTRSILHTRQRISKSHRVTLRPTKQDRWPASVCSPCDLRWEETMDTHYP